MVDCHGHCVLVKATVKIHMRNFLPFYDRVAFSMVHAHYLFKKRLLQLTEIFDTPAAPEFSSTLTRNE